MSTKPQSKAPALIAGVVAFFVGLFIGWVVLGWYLFPVQWAGGNLTVVDPTLQQDYLRAAIDAYGNNQDAGLAEWRFKNLGETGPQMLSWIYANPNKQDLAQIQMFAAAVGQEQTLQNAPVVPPAAEKPQQAVGSIISTPILVGLCALIFLGVLVVLIVVWIVRRSRRHAQPEEPDLVVPPVTPQEPLEVAPAPEMGDTLPPIQAEEEAEAQPAEELPEWLKEIAPSPAGTVRLEDASDQTATGEAAEADTFVFPLELVEEKAAPPVEAATVVLPVPTAAPLASETLAAEEVPTETAEETQAKFSRNIETLKDIGREQGEQLRAAGVNSPLLLLRKGATRQGRRELARLSGIDEKLILNWVNHVDLLRVRGIGPEYADLLEAAGVDSVVEMATRDARNLQQRLVAINQQDRLVGQTPSLNQVANWIDQARKLPRTVTH